MSNLGAYQTVVTGMKRVGGPKKAVAMLVGTFVVSNMLTGAGCYILGKLNGNEKKYKVYKFKKNAEYKGEQFYKGDKYIVLERDHSTIIIMKKDNMEYPYILPIRFLIDNTDICVNDLR